MEQANGPNRRIALLAGHLQAGSNKILHLENPDLHLAVSKEACTEGESSSSKRTQPRKSAADMQKEFDVFWSETRKKLHSFHHVLPLKQFTPDEMAFLLSHMDNHNHEDRRKAREYMNVHYELFQEKWSETRSLDERRKDAIQRTLQMIQAGLTSVEDFRDNVGRYFAVIESMYAQELSAGSMCTITLSLFGATLQFLSTQHKDVVHQISTGESVACFAMSELGHGSATALNETTATFDASTGEFVIHTPSTTAQKYWIGVSLLSANWTIVYARLITNGKDYGVHPFLVPLRDRVSGPLRPGVHVSTIGKKMGLDGIDNGRIFFDHYRVPRNYLLDKIATVSAEGHYSTPYTSENKRFAAIFAGLVIARIALGTIAAGYGRMACEIAIRYAHTRHAFAIAKGGPEVPIITYASHQLRLFPRLANAFAISFLGHACKAPLLKNNVEELMHGKDLHLDACVLKAFGSWYTQDALQEAREACGGQGYLMRNLLPQWRKDIDILVTLDGDNTLLCQQITKVLIDRLRSHVTHQNLLQNVGEVLTAEFRANLGFLRTVGLHSHASLLRMFRAREDVLLYTLVKNMRSDAGRTKGSESDGQFRGWNNNIQLVNRVAVAHAERRMAEEFSRGIGHLRSHPRVAEAFDNLFYLFCFTRIHDDPWFVAGKIISRSQWEEVGQRIGEVCRAIAPYSLTLVESFRTPAWMLHGTIAEDWVRVNDRNNELD